MAIFFNKKEINQIFHNSKPIMIVYQNGVILWEAINSCFGKGFWINSKGWVNTDGWRNTN